MISIVPQSPLLTGTGDRVAGCTRKLAAILCENERTAIGWR